MIKDIKAFNYMQIDMHTYYVYVNLHVHMGKKCQRIDISYDMKNTHTIIKNTELYFLRKGDLKKLSRSIGIE